MSELTEWAKVKQRIEILNQNAWEIRITDSIKAFNISRKAFKLAKKINYNKGIAEALRIEGFVFMRKAKYEKALSVLNESASLFELLNDKKGLAPTYEYIGIVQRNMGKGKDALENIFKSLDLSRQTNFFESEATALYHVGVTYRNLANYEKALEYLYESLALCRQYNFKLMEAYNLHIIGTIFFETDSYEKALQFFLEALTIRRDTGDRWGEAGSLFFIGFTFMKLDNLEEAKLYCQNSLDICQTTEDKKGEANALFHLSEIHKKMGDEIQAIKFATQSFNIFRSIFDKRGEIDLLLLLASLDDNSTSKYDKLITACTLSKEIKAIDLLSKTHYHLYQYYFQKKDYKQAIAELEEHRKLENELHKSTIDQKILNLEISYKSEQARKEAEEVRTRNEQLTKLNGEIKNQKKQLEKTLFELKSTQSQLIQSEKMASLGELTAGIAHEIQNPLNFVNNFSEVNKELIEELRQAILKNDLTEIETLLNNIHENEEKVTHHGKRAEGIVKSMLQHSRKNSGEKELTNLNALCNEYLRLAYHGMRAKDKTFKAEYKLELAPNLPKINVIPQDIGRVLLNLFNNAFQAVADVEKPEVFVSTIRQEGHIEIRVTDNGQGIPEQIRDKIFQPFFTTKPTGQGTGLGLSLSYDIVKAHGGEIKVETKQNEGTEFTIVLGTNTN